ncbi:Cof-type HAD-IIB family hydrolase [Sneathia sanguinegens]|uniref:Cof-type HAD-IIB family hydrolase n=1 Tax=Sneathia sanguinegens TaxID=40543 RepID=A0ABT7HKQ9_9FUSO|nr:Cof-type HAD-IIB family hydrolase [Sneathia sanguinegens]MDK9580617.1 Cof-type HAD-IIB family hydrolase [Sneathia sanguinegens]
MKKLIITDLDGTLLQNSVEIYKKDLEKMREFQEKYLIGVATGRSLKEIKYIEKNNNLKFSYKIAFNGAQIQKDDELIFEKHIDEDILDRLYKFLQENNLIFDALDGEKRIGNFNHENPKSLWNMELICVHNPYGLLKGLKIYKVNIRPKAEECDEILKRLKEKFEDLSIFKTAKTRIEVCSKNLSKGVAIKKIKEIDKLDIIALGDSGNDVEMFKEADYSICMHHAPENVKREADLIVKSICEIEEI